jgi:hypothetical protein
MAREYGVEGFCYWHYWFGNGRRLLDRPFTEVLESGNPDFPFCLAWANHSWHGIYCGVKSKEPLIEQTYNGLSDYEHHFYDVLPAFKDKRYITVDGKPFFLVFSPLEIPDPEEFIDCWQQLAIRNGLKGIHFVAHTYKAENIDLLLSRGSDVDIYKERKRLGEKLVPRILKAINNDIDHTVFSFIPNTAEVAFYGMLQGLDDYLNEEKVQQIAALGHHPDMEELEVILSRRIRSEKVAIKDIKLRTFIAEGNSRNDLAAHVYDITYGSLVPGVDNLVIIDDSIVRGTTLKQSIIGILDRLGPKKIVIVSSSPQVRYPDYFGIDADKMNPLYA